MNKALGLKFAKALSRLEGKAYLEALISFAAAPTIQKKKPAALMNFTAGGKKTAALWRQFGEEICNGFHLDFFVLKEHQGGLIVLIYRRKLLEWYVNHKRNRFFLHRMGYEIASELNHKLTVLSRRFETLCPHEVGIFLGMPVEDVEGFIEHKGKNYLLCRYWKVYEKPRRAELLFNAYDKARTQMMELLVG